MSRKKKPTAHKKPNRHVRRRKYLSVVVIVLIAAMGVAAALYPWRTLPRARNVLLLTAPVPSPTLPPSSNPSKEYIYSGGKLVAIETPKSDQTITFNSLADKTYGDAPFALSATASSGLPITFTVTSGSATVSSSTLTINGAGTVSIRADQSGSDGFNPAQPVTQSFNVAKATATVTLTNLTQTYDGAAHYASATTTPSNLSVNFSYSQSGTNVSSPTNAGSYSTVATVADSNYQGSATGTLTIAKATQIITFSALAGKTYGDAPFTVSASSSSSLTVSFSVVSGPANVSGSTVTITGAGNVTIRASQAGNSNYNPAADVDRAFNVAKASATITLSNLSQTYNGSAETATATTSPPGLSGVTVTYNSSSTAPTNAGNYAVVASLTNANYSASNATGTLVIAKATPSVSWNNPADMTYGTALGSSQLNATGMFGGNSLAGTFAYSPAAGTILNVGNSQTLSSTFTPTDGVNFNGANGTAHINVTPACGSTNGFAQSRSITLDHTKVPNTDQANFPVLISGTYSYLATASNGGQVRSANGYDIVFYSDAALTTKLDHEIRKYVATTGEIEMWVRIPTLSHTTDTVFYMGYGNSAISTSKENKTGVWDSNFLNVLHFGDGTTFNGTDSTSDSNTGTLESPASAAAGKIGGAFYSNTGDVTRAHGYNHGSNNITVSAWVKTSDKVAVLDEYGTNNDLLYVMVGDPFGLGSAYAHKASILFGETNHFVLYAAIGTSNLDDGNWHHVSAVRDETNKQLRIYVDGNLEATTAYSGLSSSNPTGINSRVGLGLGYGLGYVDEFRESHTSRSADWIKTEYNNQSSPASFYTISANSGGGCFAHARSITIDHTKVPNTDQANFPVLISGTYSYLATASNGGQVRSANGYDIVFYSDAALTTKLDHEIRKYVATTGEIEMWVRIPTLSHTTDTVFYMGYGNSAISTSKENKTGVWDSNFLNVLHFGDGTTFNGTDSTSDSNTGTLESPASAAAGKIGGAFYSNTGDVIRAHGYNHGSNNVTVSAWVKTSDKVAVLDEFGTNNDLLFLMVGDPFGLNASFAHKAVIYFGETNYFNLAAAIGTTSVDDGNWHHVSAVRDETNKQLRIYVDGNLEATTAYSGLSSSNPTGINSRVGLGLGYGLGYVDEFRESHTSRSADWIKTEYNNQSSPASFYTIGSAQ